ncbi:Polyprotein [Phytophthora palmivora]|uniref:Polyprotein n=1 Tax=Phytophthora palmivora TaxID=4796 RepID=A0A2P4XGG5_9STRA|nr:Polyprotein [Phytophthora palmivora]
MKAYGNPVYETVREFTDDFPDKVPAALPAERGICHEIDLAPGAKYCVTRQWPLPRDQVKAIDDFFEGRRQATGGWRIVHAFNKLNDATIPTQTPIPRKDMVLDSMSGSVVFSAIDLTDGFYQILMRESDIPLTAVSTPSGSYFGDVFVHSRAEDGFSAVEVHIQYLRQVVQVMRENKLYANLKKCVFYEPEIPVLGCYLCQGLANYLHKYTKAYPGPIQPLSYLLKKDATWSWRPEHQAAFDSVKKCLASAPILMLPNESKHFHVMCGACDFAIGRALMQFDIEGHERVVRYQSRQMKPAEPSGINLTSASPEMALRDAIVAAYTDDAVYSNILAYLCSPSDETLGALSRNTRNQIDRYHLDGDLLYYNIDLFDAPRVVVPNDDDLRARIIHEFHDSPTGAHLGREKTFAAISRDFSGPACTKGCTAVHFVDCVFRHHGFPGSIISDRDPPFTSAFWTVLFQLLGTKLSMSTADHPVTDDQTEQVYRVLEDVRRSYATSFASWSKFLPLAEFALNNAELASTGLTPFFANNVRHLRVPALLAVGHPTVTGASTLGGDDDGVNDDYVETSGAHDPETLYAVTRSKAIQALTTPGPAASPLAAWEARTLIDPGNTGTQVAANYAPKPLVRQVDNAAVSAFIQRHASIARFVRDALQDALDKQKGNADKRGRKNMATFRIGEQALLVVKVNGEAYTLDIPTSLRLHPTFYVGRLKKYHPADSDGDSPGSTKDPTPSQDAPSQNAPVDDTASSEAKAAPTSLPTKNLTLDKGKARAQAAKAAPQKRADEGAAAAKKRAAPGSPTSEPSIAKGFRSLFDSSDERRGLREISNDLDEQQERYQAAQLQGTPVPSTPVYPRGYYPPDAGSGSPMFLEHLKAPRGLNHGRTSRGAYERALVQVEPIIVNGIEAARCVLLAPHRIPLKEFTSLRKKPEDRGGLFTVWGYPWVQPENTATQTQAEDLFWRWVSLKNFTVQELKELREDRLLSYVLDQRDLRIEFAHLVAKRQLHSVMEGLRQQSKSSAQDERGYSSVNPGTIPHLNSLRAVNPEPVFRLPRAL